MFLDVSNLVQMQGEMITRIEDHVNSKYYTDILEEDANDDVTIGAVIDVERGREDLGKAEKFKKAATKKKFILIAILVVVVIIILLVILSEFGAFSSSGATETIIKVNFQLKTSNKSTNLINSYILQHEYIYNFGNGSQVVRDSEDQTLVKDNTVTLGSTVLPDLDYEGPGK